jgi:uncharacterized protein YceH (UPF0502 family)
MHESPPTPSASAVPDSVATRAEPVLSPPEARVLGCLIEKELTTPDYYPLTLNALVNACNQRNNRDPVYDFSPRDVELAIEALRSKRLVALFAGADARVPKFKQTLDQVWPMEPAARALMAELLLRGPQTTAELRARASRMHPIETSAEAEEILGVLAHRPAGPLVRRLPRQPGKKEERWGQLLTGEPDTAAAPDDPPEARTTSESAAPGEPVRSKAFSVAIALPPEAEARIAALEAEVRTLRSELAALKRALGAE